MQYYLMDIINIHQYKRQAAKKTAAMLVDLANHSSQF